MGINIANQDQQQSILGLLLGIWGHLGLRRRTQLCFLLLVMLASGAAEMVSLGAVLPFLIVLGDPNRLWQLPQIQPLIAFWSYENPDQLLLPATLVFASAAIISAVIRLTNLWMNGRLAAAVGSDLSCEAYRRTLYQPYRVHVQRNSSHAITSIITHIGLTVAVLNAFLQLITSVVVATGIFIGLLLIDTAVAVTSASLFGITYASIAFNSRRELNGNSYKISEALNSQLKSLQEGLNGIRDVLLDGSQATYLKRFRQSDRGLRKLQAKNSFMAISPRYILESLGMVVIAVIGWVLVSKDNNAVGIVPLLGSLALGAQRLLPALQQIYSGWAALKGSNAALSDVLSMLNQPVPQIQDSVKPLRVRRSIVLQAVDFLYSSENKYIIKGLNLEIKYGERVGLIGETGSGKSTLADLLMGLLEPTSGFLLVDEINIHDSNHPENLSAWRSSIAHVPQNIFLADASIAENIAFGVPIDQIDYERVKKAARQSMSASFIEQSAYGYQTFVGERGIRLSGGQRQRIGIARALYKRAQVLVLDEATSALDNNTEGAVMEAIDTLSKDLIIIMIAHRLSTLQKCDRLIRISQGTVSADDSPSQFINY